MEEVERRRKPKPSVQGLHEELSTELTPLSGKKAIFRDALKQLIEFPHYCTTFMVMAIAGKKIMCPKKRCSA